MDNFEMPISVDDPQCIYTITTDIERLSVPAHRHEYHDQLVYMIKGTLHVYIEGLDYFLPEGFIGLIPKNCLHQLHSRNEMVKMMLVYFPSDAGFSSFIMLNSNAFIIHNLRYIGQLPAKINAREQAVFYHFTDAFLQVVLAEPKGHFLPLKGIVVPQNERLESIILYLNEHFKEEIHLVKIASQFGFTVRNLTRLFKKENISFNNYLNYLRVTCAIELFANNQDNMEQIAYEVGYNSSSNFSRTFKKFTGLAPREFVNNNIVSHTMTP